MNPVRSNNDQVHHIRYIAPHTLLYGPQWKTWWKMKILITLLQGRSQRLYHVAAHQKMESNVTYIYFTFQIANNKGADQTARMRMLVCAFVVGKQQIQVFSRWGPYDVEAQASWPPPGYAPVCGHTEGTLCHHCSYYTTIKGSLVHADFPMPLLLANKKGVI